MPSTSPQNVLTVFRPSRRGPTARPGLTLVELLVTVSIIAILAGLFLGGLFSAQESAKVMKTRAMIVKLNNLIMPRYEAYRTRRVPISIQPFTYGGGAPQAVRPQAAAKYRIDALHELMRMEMPDRMTDIVAAPITLAYSNANPANTTTISRPALNQAYYNALSVAAFNASGSSTPIVSTSDIPGNINTSNQGAECLYLIVTMAFVDELGGRDLFNESNIGDTDQDGLNEFLDGWGNPIAFLRWCPGFTESELNGGGGQVGSGSNSGMIICNGLPAGTASYGLARRTGAYNNRQVTVYSYNGGTPVTQTATIASSVYSAGVTTLNLYSYTPLSVTPSAGDCFAIDPDPFDPTHAYPNASQVFNGTNTQIVPFAIYPLIYSAGPDKTFGVLTDFGNSSNKQLSYAAPAGSPSILFPNAVNNFPFLTDNTSGDSDFGESMGTTKDIASEQAAVSTWEAGGWMDNIHNHMIGNR